MFGVTPMPIYDPRQEISYLREFMIFFKPGDIVKFKPVDEAEYRSVQAQVADGTFRYRQAPVTFELDRALADPRSYNRTIMEKLNGN